MAIEELRQDPMMAHLIASLEQGRDIGHYGRLVFVMVARHFFGENEVLDYLMWDRDVDERKARSLLAQVNARGYNPPNANAYLIGCPNKASLFVRVPRILISAILIRIWTSQRRSTIGFRTTMRAKPRISLNLRAK